MTSADLTGLPAEQAFNLGAVTAELITEAEARGYQRAIDALRDENRFMRWLIDYHLEHPEDRRHSCEFHVAYLEAASRSATPDADPAPGVPVDTEATP